jgi:hypothetical protein
MEMSKQDRSGTSTRQQFLEITRIDQLEAASLKARSE